MKKVITTLAVVLTAAVVATAQSTNPLHYSGRMYVEAIEIHATPRYVSFEDHAIVSQQTRIPSVQISKCDMDFEKGMITIDEKTMEVKVNTVKKYDTERGWVVVLYMDMIHEGDKAELVWLESGKPFFQQITKSDEGVMIARMILSRKPYVADEREALMDLLQGLGTI